MSRELHTDFTRIFDIVEYQVKKYPQKKALNYFSGGEWRSLSIHEVVDRSYYLASQLIQKGLKKGDKLIIIPQSGLVDWVCIDMACQYLGIILVPLHYTISIDEFHQIIKESEAKICITVDTALFYKFRATQQMNDVYKMIFCPIRRSRPRRLCPQTAPARTPVSY